MSLIPGAVPTDYALTLMRMAGDIAASLIERLDQGSVSPDDEMLTEQIAMLSADLARRIGEKCLEKG